MYVKHSDVWDAGEETENKRSTINSSKMNDNLAKLTENAQKGYLSQDNAADPCFAR